MIDIVQITLLYLFSRRLNVEPFTQARSKISSLFFFFFSFLGRYQHSDSDGEVDFTVALFQSCDLPVVVKLTGVRYETHQTQFNP